MSRRRAYSGGRPVEVTRRSRPDVPGRRSIPTTKPQTAPRGHPGEFQGEDLVGGGHTAPAVHGDSPTRLRHQAGEPARSSSAPRKRPSGPQVVGRRRAQPRRVCVRRPDRSAPRRHESVPCARASRRTSTRPSTDLVGIDGRHRRAPGGPRRRALASRSARRQSPVHRRRPPRRRAHRRAPGPARDRSTAAATTPAPRSSPVVVVDHHQRVGPHPPPGRRPRNCSIDGNGCRPACSSGGPDRSPSRST